MRVVFGEMSSKMSCWVQRAWIEPVVPFFLTMSNLTNRLEGNFSVHRGVPVYGLVGVVLVVVYMMTLVAFHGFVPVHRLPRLLPTDLSWVVVRLGHLNGRH